MGGLILCVCTKELYPDERLNKLDLLVHGNPQLTHGRTAFIKGAEGISLKNWSKSKHRR